MSHELTVFEWVNRLTNEFNELRIAASDVIKMKLVEFFTDASVFIVNHSSELLYGSLSVFMVVIFTILLNRALNAENKVHELDGLLDISETARKDWFKAWMTIDSENDKLNAEINDLHYELSNHKQAFESMREEFSDKLEDVRNQRDEIQTEFDEMEEARDEMEESRDEWMSDANQYEFERDELSDQLDNLKSAVPQLAYAA